MKAFITQDLDRAEKLRRAVFSAAGGYPVRIKTRPGNGTISIITKTLEESDIRFDIINGRDGLRTDADLEKILMDNAMYGLIHSTVLVVVDFSAFTPSQQHMIFDRILNGDSILTIDYSDRDLPASIANRFTHVEIQE